MEKSVTDNLRLEQRKNITHNKDGKSFRSKNKIPREIRSLFKSKRRLSKNLRKSTCAEHIKSIRKNILQIKINLKNHYDSKNKKTEDEVFLKSIENKQVLYRYIKKKQKSQMSIGPFMENNKIMEGSSAEILMNQYKSV